MFENKNIFKIQCAFLGMIYVPIIVVTLLISGISISFAEKPIFEIHNLGSVTMNSIGGNTRVPVVLDYDNDGDIDVLIVDKHGTVFVLENKIKD